MVLAVPSGCAWWVSSGTLTLGRDAFSLNIAQPIACSGPVTGTYTTIELLSFAGGVSITGSRSLVLHIVEAPSSAILDLPVTLDDSTVTVTPALGPLGTRASVPLTFGDRTTGFGFPVASRPN